MTLIYNNINVKVTKNFKKCRVLYFCVFPICEYFILKAVSNFKSFARKPKYFVCRKCLKITIITKDARVNSDLVQDLRYLAPVRARAYCVIELYVKQQVQYDNQSNQ
jgi:hypothetical protein